MELGREADNGHSLARLEPMDQVGGKADTCGGLSADTAFLVGDGAEGVVAVEPEANFSRLAASQTGMSAGRNLTDCYKIENAPQVCCLATRLRGLLSLVSKNFLDCDCKCNANFAI